MAKISIVRTGSTRAVLVDKRVAGYLVKSGKFQHADAKLSGPKRAAKVEHATRRVDAQKETGGGKAQASVSTSQTQVALKPSELQAMSVADLKILAAQRGLKANPGDTKDDLVGRIYRYMRRDMRAQ